MNHSKPVGYTRVTVDYTLSAMHNLLNPDLSDLRNEELYGACFRKHGHDYHIRITLHGQIDPLTGLSIDRDHLDQVVEQVILRKYDGHFLNEHFANTSGEGLVEEFHALLKPHFAQGQLVSVSMQETRKNWFSYSELA
jgi:6-pyruvoyltetrahydropterin/6-carboxytetrahydropterin synthase